MKVSTSTTAVKDAKTPTKHLLNVKNRKLTARSSSSINSNEWDALSENSKDEIDQLVEILKSVKQGDFSVRLPYELDGVLSRAGELLNDIIGLNEHMSEEFVRVGKIVGQEGRMTERASVGPAKGNWAISVTSVNQL